jgi:small subunit ribosomal protein S16
MLILRLQRLGKSKQPIYRLIVSEKKHDTQYGQLEILGNYNPTLKENRFTVKADRVKYWLSVGAQMSNTVNNLLINNKIIEGKKKSSVKITQKRAKKMTEKKKAEDDAKAKAKADAEAKAAAEAAAVAAPAPAPEAPVAEAPATETTNA